MTLSLLPGRKNKCQWFKTYGSSIWDPPFDPDLLGQPPLFEPELGDAILHKHMVQINFCA
jgi:hypothetical protein